MNFKKIIIALITALTLMTVIIFFNKDSSAWSPKRFLFLCSYEFSVFKPDIFTDKKVKIEMEDIWKQQKHHLTTTFLDFEKDIIAYFVYRSEGITGFVGRADLKMEVKRDGEKAIINVFENEKLIAAGEADFDETRKRKVENLSDELDAAECAAIKKALENLSMLKTP